MLINIPSNLLPTNCSTDKIQIHSFFQEPALVKIGGVNTPIIENSVVSEECLYIDSLIFNFNADNITCPPECHLLSVLVYEKKEHYKGKAGEREADYTDEDFRYVLRSELQTYIYSVCGYVKSIYDETFCYSHSIRDKTFINYLKYNTTRVFKIELQVIFMDHSVRIYLSKPFFF
ncbi:hypothetical protein CDIK_1923 [Cucumispora dikerogammari]|nr:hypothetical protein CDIK_1923 [Cucumispora dikerogammari]